MTTLEALTEAFRTAVGADSGLGGKTLKYDFKGEGFIFVDRASVTNEDKPSDVTFTGSLDVIVGILAGTISPQKAMLRGKVKVSPMSAALKIGPQIEALSSRLPLDGSGSVLSENEDVVDHPLPPMKPVMRLAKREMFDIETAESFQPVAGFAGAFLRKTDVARQTGGDFDVNVLKANPDVEWTASPWKMHHYDFNITYFIQGWMDFEFEGIGKVRFEKGMVMHQPAFNRHREGAASQDFMAIVITSPAQFATTLFIWNEDTDSYDEVVIENSTSGDNEEFGKLQTAVSETA